MALTNKRIIDLPERDTLNSDDYTVVDGSNGGTGKYKISQMQESVNGLSQTVTDHGTRLTTAEQNIETNADDIADLKEDLSYLNEFAYEDFDDLNMQVNSQSDLLVEYKYGRYNSSGYANTMEYINNVNMLPTGMYDIVANIGDNYQYGLWTYVSDTSGTLVQNFGNASRYGINLTGPIKITVRKLTGGNFTSEEIRNIKSTLIVRKTAPTALRLSDVKSNLQKTQKNIADLQLDVFLQCKIPVQYKIGRFTESGYVASNAFINDVVPLDAGVYDITTALGSNYQFTLIKLTSTTTGTTIVSYRNSNTSHVVIDSDTKICVRKLDGVSFTPVEVQEVKEKLIFTKTASDAQASVYPYVMPKWSEEIGEYSFGMQTGRGVYNGDFTVNKEKSIHAYNSDGTAVDVRIALDTAINPVGISEFDVIFYVPDATKVSTITFFASGTSFTRSYTDIKEGWNVAKFGTYLGDLSTWSSVTGFRIYGSGTSGIDFYIGKIVAIRPPKGNLIFVNDGAYKTFFDVGYPDLKTMNVPVTWALSPKRIIQEESLFISMSDLESIAGDSCSEFSYHSWQASPASTMTAKEVQEECGLCLHFLKKNGLLPKYIWRAATTQNTSPNNNALIGFLDAIATGTSSAGATTFPFPNPYNVPRFQLHGRDNATIDAMFALMQKTRCTYVVYTHGITETDTHDMTSAEWAYFKEALSTAIESGYVNATTFNRLMMEYYNPLQN